MEENKKTNVQFKIVLLIVSICIFSLLLWGIASLFFPELNKTYIILGGVVIGFFAWMINSNNNAN